MIYVLKGKFCNETLVISYKHIFRLLAYFTIVKRLGEVRKMAKKKRPSIEQFREFVRKHPHLRNEVKQKQTTWQELFEEWYLLGESHPRWGIDQVEQESRNQKQSNIEEKEKEKESDQTQEIIGMVLNAIKNMDINQIQQYIKSANQAIGTIQGLLQMFQGGDSSTREESTAEQPKLEQRGNPFMFRKD